MGIDLQGARVTVMGLGRFGGGVGVSRWLVARGADVLVTDLEPAETLRESVERLHGLPIRFRFGEHNVSDFTACDLVVVNPAVDPRNNRFLRAAAAAQVPTTSEIRLLIQHLPMPRARVIGVTGTAGKSTTTAMIGHALTRSLGERHVHVGGNLGGSLLERLPSIQTDDWIVLELSSFMLEDMREDRWSPHVAVVTNLSANHIDRHGTLEAYAAAKQELLNHQADRDVAVLGESVAAWPLRDGVARLIVREPAPLLPLRVPGRHNQLNAAMALTACTAAVGAADAVPRDSLADFPGLPHRLQFVVERDGVRCFNDSKATTPEATCLAVQSFDDSRRIHLIAGGYDKGSDLAPIARLATSLAGLYTIGATGRVLADAAGSSHSTSCRTLDAAVARALRSARPGDILLLSPGCASWDQFTNYEQRGEDFARLVRLPAAAAPA
jgi:UDP-N-acetylmuramoylalanine--D-glutamate ligase